MHVVMKAQNRARRVLGLPLAVTLVIDIGPPVDLCALSPAVPAPGWRIECHWAQATMPRRDTGWRLA